MNTKVIVLVTAFWMSFSFADIFKGDPFIEMIRETSKSHSMDGDTEGHGGDSVQCTTDGVTTTSLLDTYEAKVSFPWLSLDLGPEKLSLDERIEFFIERLKFIDPARAVKWKKEAGLFMSRVSWVQKDLPFIQDTGSLVIHPNCKVKQLAIRYKKGDKITYEVNEPLWKLLPPAEQAALILHEVIYEEGIEVGQSHSQMSRYFNIALLTKRIKDFTTELKYTTWLKEIGWEGFVKGKVPLELKSLEFQNEFIENGRIYYGAKHELFITLGKNEFKFSNANASIAYYKEASLSHMVRVEMPPILRVGIFSLGTERKSSNVSLYKSEEVLDVNNLPDNVFPIQGKEVWLFGHVSFHENGQIKGGRLARETLLTCANGKVVKFGFADSINVENDKIESTHCN